MKNIILLGASGSIGTQTLDVVKQHEDEFKIIAMALGSNIKLLEEEIIPNFDCKYYHVKKLEDAKYLSDKYPNLKFNYGDENIENLIEEHADQADVVINSLVGVLGLKPSIKTLECDLQLALANKESLVVGGDILTKMAKEKNTTILPIDSEHSAIFQCLQGNKHKEIEKLIITASGGSFRNLDRDQLKDVTVADALNHPNWSMGKRITIDSATMMNKGFEVIEAHYLFDVDYDMIDVIINEQSIIHSMVEYEDTSVIAQLGNADMRLPIQYALTYPNRMKLKVKDKLDLAKVKQLTFREMSFERYPLLKLAFDAGRKGGNSGAIINAADEVCVQLFIDEKISFLDIEKYIFDAYEHIKFIANPTVDELMESDKQTREYILSKVGGM